MSASIGNEIYNLAKLLWPLDRSITGDGNRKTLKILQDHLPELKICEIATNTKAFDWQIPQEWSVKEAWIKTPSGEKICDFSKNNLHLVGYSEPINKKINKDELLNHLHSLPKQPNAIPYVTSYYKKTWGFCINENDKNNLSEGDYEVFIDSKFYDGFLTYGELIINESKKEEVFLSTYICHPSMANNELSGPCVTTYIAKWLSNLKKLRYKYRIIFIPETIGSIFYLSQNYKSMKESVIAGFNISCIGDDRTYSFLPSRKGNTLSDNIALHVLKHLHPNFKKYNWNDRGSDERQYCAPGIDLPIASLMRSKYGEYPEYHTSLDNLENVVSAKGLEGGYDLIMRSINAIESNLKPKVKILCEPQLGKRELYPSLSKKNNLTDQVDKMMNLITWSDGENTLLEIAERVDTPIWELQSILNILIKHDIIELI